MGFLMFLNESLVAPCMDSYQRATNTIWSEQAMSGPCSENAIAIWKTKQNIITTFVLMTLTSTMFILTWILLEVYVGGLCYIQKFPIYTSKSNIHILKPLQHQTNYGLFSQRGHCLWSCLLVGYGCVACNCG